MNGASRVLLTEEGITCNRKLQQSGLMGACFLQKDKRVLLNPHTPLFHSMFAKTLTPLLLAKYDDILLPRALSFPTEKHGENSIKKHIYIFPEFCSRPNPTQLEEEEDRASKQATHREWDG